MAEKKALDVIAETAQAVATSTWKTVANPNDVGRKLVNISRYGHNVRMSMNRELQYSRLLRRIYDMKGNVTHEIAVPYIDMLSDLDRDLLLHGGVSAEQVASFFEAAFVLSSLPDRLLDVSRLILPTGSNLPQSLADLESITEGKSGVDSIAAVSLMSLSQNEHPQDCVSRFDMDLEPRRNFEGKKGFARLKVSRFPNIANSLKITHVNVKDLRDHAVHFETLLKSQQKLIAFAMNKEHTEAELFYESANRKLDVVRIEQGGVSASRPDDFAKSDDVNLDEVVGWVRLTAALMYESLQLVTTFPIKEISVTLLESVAVGMKEELRAPGTETDPVRELKSGEMPSRRIVASESQMFQSGLIVHDFINSLRRIIMLSAYVREAANEFAELGPNETRPKFALTLKELQYQQSLNSVEMPKFSYEHRDRIIEKMKKNVKNNTTWTERRPATEYPFETAGVLDSMGKILIDKMRQSVEKAQKGWKTGWKTLQPAHVSGSLWLDRIAKGKLLTTERARELTRNQIKKTVPRELISKRELGFYLPMYDRTIVFPNVDDLSDIEYNRMQIGSATDLTSAVSVLVAIILWTNAQKKQVVVTAIKEDEKGTENLINYTGGELGAAICNAFQETMAEEQQDVKNDEEKGLKITNLIEIVGDLQGERDNDWIVREVLSIAAFWGITCTESSIDGAGYLKSVLDVRSVHRACWEAINANTSVPLRNVNVKFVMTTGGRYLFYVQDNTIPRNKAVLLEPVGGGGSVDLMAAVLSEDKKKKSLPKIVANMSVTNYTPRQIRKSEEGIVISVSAH